MAVEHAPGSFSSTSTTDASGASSVVYTGLHGENLTAEDYAKQTSDKKKDYDFLKAQNATWEEQQTKMAEEARAQTGQTEDEQRAEQDRIEAEARDKQTKIDEEERAKKQKEQDDLAAAYSKAQGSWRSAPSQW